MMPKVDMPRPYIIGMVILAILGFIFLRYQVKHNQTFQLNAGSHELMTPIPANEKKTDTWRNHVTMAGNRAFISFNGKDTLPDVDAEKDILPDAEAKSVILLILNDFEKENSVTIKNWIPYYTGYGNYRPIRVSGLWIDFEPNPKPTK